jgi:hypothetical protein
MKEVLIKTICLLNLLYGCSESNPGSDGVEIGKFPQRIYLNKPAAIDVPPVNFNVQDLAICNDLLITADLNDTVCRVFETPECRYIGGYITKGPGPDEILNPGSIGLYSTADNIILAGLFKVLIIDPDSAGFKISGSVKMPGKVCPLNYIFTLRDRRIYGSVLNDLVHREFYSYDPQSDEITGFTDYPSWLSDHPVKKWPVLTLGPVTVKPDKRRFARAYVYHPQLRIFDENGEQLRSIGIMLTGNQQKRINKIDDPDEPTDIYFFERLYSTERYIYASFRVQGGKDNICIVQPEILVFDWDGKPIAEIVSNDSSLNIPKVFAVSSDDKYLYYTSDSCLNRIFRSGLRNTAEN